MKIIQYFSTNRHRRLVSFSFGAFGFLAILASDTLIRPNFDPILIPKKIHWMHETCGETSISMTVQPDTRHPLRVQPVEGMALTMKKTQVGMSEVRFSGVKREGRPYHN